MGLIVTSEMLADLRLHGDHPCHEEYMRALVLLRGRALSLDGALTEGRDAGLDVGWFRQAVGISGSCGHGYGHGYGGGYGGGHGDGDGYGDGGYGYGCGDGYGYGDGDGDGYGDGHGDGDGGGDGGYGYGYGDGDGDGDGDGYGGLGGGGYWPRDLPPPAKMLAI